MSLYINVFPQNILNLQYNFIQIQPSVLTNTNDNIIFGQTEANIAPQTSNGLSSRKKFSFEEDELLKQLVNKFGLKKWKLIAQKLPGRTGRQCRDRYMNYLNPGFFHGQWSKNEDELLLAKYIELGPKWSQIKKFFNNRNANSIKNRWNYFISKQINNNNEMIKDLNKENTIKKDELINNNNIQAKDTKIENSIKIPPSFELFHILN